MISATLSVKTNPDCIRKLNTSRDLDDVANLIETCFPIHQDHDGKVYIQEMRKAARDMRMVGWFSNLAEMGSDEIPGFVWEENGQIIGNLSLIPFQQAGRRIHLIANVAVHQSHRRRGIARALTERALRYLQQRNEPHVWLQVRDDNPAAINLYRSVGFVDQVSRTTWRIRPCDLHRATRFDKPALTIKHRRKSDWQLQQQWLEKAYPLCIRWNLPVDFRRFSPDLWQRLSNFMDSAAYKHWAVEADDQYHGVITWQKTTSYANNLWLAFKEDTEADTLPAVLGHVCKRLANRHPLSIDYPKGRFAEGFKALGFECFRTLVWMCCPLGQKFRLCIDQVNGRVRSSVERTNVY